MSTSTKTPLDHAFRGTRPAFVAATVLSLFASLLLFVGPVYSLQVYDRVLTSRSVPTLAMLSAIALVLYAGLALLEHCRSRLLAHAAVQFDGVLAGPAFAAALAASGRTKCGTNAQFLRDVDTLREFVGGPTVIGLIDAFWAPLFLVVCFMVHPYFGLLATAGAAALLGLAVANERLTRPSLVESAVLSMSAVENLSATLRNAEVVTGLGMTRAVRGMWERRHEAALVSGLVAGERGGTVVALSKFVRNVLQSGMIGLGIYLSIHQEVSVGVIFAVTLVMGRGLSPIEMAVMQWKSIVSMRSAKQRLTKVFEALPEGVREMRYPRPRPDLTVENLVVLAPGASLPVVRNVSLSVSGGEAVAVIGGSGAGKSSFARAVVGAWPKAAGSVRLGGYDLDHFSDDQRGELVGYVPQDVELFAGTVRDNIARFLDATDDQVVAAAKMAGAHETIQRLPKGYLTEIGDSGAGLSGGQRQRVALARAVFGTPALVVLDEPNSNLDQDGDVALGEAIRSLKAAGVAVLVVSHKPSVLSSCDRIAVMHEGAVVKVDERVRLMESVSTETRVRQAA